MKRSIFIFISVITLNLAPSLTAAQSAMHKKPAQRAMILRIPASFLQRCAASLENADARLSKSLTNQEEYFEKQQKSADPVDGCPEIGAGVLSIGTLIALFVVKTGKNMCLTGARMLGEKTHAH